MLCAKLRGNFLRRLSDNLKTSYNRTTQRFVHDEVLELQSRSLGNEVVYFDQNMAKVLTRLGGHLAILPGYTAQ